MQEVDSQPANGKKKSKQALVISFYEPERRFKTVVGKELKPWQS